MRVSDLILVSDLDGTIIPSSGVISQKNIDAINKFRVLGGTFAIATGRSPLHAQYICDILDVTSLIICNNGACIFDVAKQKNVWSKNLDDSFVDVIKYVMQKYSDKVAIQAISDQNEYYIVNETELFRKVITRHFKCDSYVTAENLPNNICKILFLIDEDALNKIADDIVSIGFVGFEFVKSGGACFEMMSGGVTKGLPLKKLAELYNKNLSNVVAIGDYYNDIELLKTASFSAAVNNAPELIKQTADIVVKTCDQDGLADFINILIDKYD